MCLRKKVPATPLYNFHNIWRVFYFGLWRVSLAEYILVLRVPFPCCFADGQMYYGYCIHCLYLAMGDDLTKGNGHSTSSFAVVGMIKLWHCIRLSVCVILKLWCFRYSWTWFVITLFELWCNRWMLWTECICGWWSLDLLRSWPYVWFVVWNPSRFHGLQGLYGLKIDGSTMQMVTIRLNLL